MKINNIHDILSQLGRELEKARGVDPDAHREMSELHARIGRLEQPEQSEVDWLAGRVREMETRFIAEHPTIARVARELADALGKMGI